MNRGLVVAVAAVVLAMLAFWLGQQHLTLSGGVVTAGVLVAGIVGAAAGWLTRQTVDRDRFTAQETEWKDRVTGLQGELGQLRSRAQSLSNDVRTRDEQIVEHERTIAALTVEASRADSLQNILRDKDRLINDLDERVQALTIALEDRTTAMGQRGSELATALERQASLEREISSLTSEMAQMIPKTAVDSISARHQESQHNNTEEVARLKRQLAARDQSLKDAAAKIATLEARTSELATLRAQLADAELRASHGAQRIEELEREVAMRVPEADYHEAKTQIAALRGATSKLQDVEIQLMSTGEQATELSRRVQELEEQLRDSVPRAEYEALRANLRPAQDDFPTVHRDRT
jgi:chromosome segregation ATPase